VHYTLTGGAKVAEALQTDMDKAANVAPPLPMRPQQ
jgi:hypothetical protein